MVGELAVKLNIGMVKYPTNLLLKLCIAVDIVTTAITYVRTYYILLQYYIQCKMLLL